MILHAHPDRAIWNSFWYGPRPVFLMRLCFVAHRYAPFPGGTEVYMRALAEESLRRGHEIWVFADQHQGDVKGVRLTSDPAIFETQFDLVVVHGPTKGAQQRVLKTCGRINGPVLYMLVAHHSNHVVARGLRDCAAAGWSTPLDLSIIQTAGFLNKARRVRHGFDPASSAAEAGFRRKYGIAADRRMFVSCGGYWPHKRMKELAHVFERANIGDALLVTTGYHAMARSMPNKSDRVLPLLIENRADVLSAIMEADCYLMHSRDEGFGLVLLEAMFNRTPWISHAVGGAPDLKQFGALYETQDELLNLLENFKPDPHRAEQARNFVIENHLIAHTVDDIEAIAFDLTDFQRPVPRRRLFWPFLFPGRG